jgi:hypothetical protein
MFASGLVNSSVSMLSSDDLGLHEPMMPWSETTFIAHFDRAIDDAMRASIASIHGVSIISYIPYDTFLFAASSAALVDDVRALRYAQSTAALRGAWRMARANTLQRVPMRQARLVGDGASASAQALC